MNIKLLLWLLCAGLVEKMVKHSRKRFGDEGNAARNRVRLGSKFPNTKKRKKKLR